MSIDHVQLSGALTSALYKSVLVEKAAHEGGGHDLRYKYLGNNQKKIIFLVNSNDAVFIEDKHLTFITKLLEACKMNIGDVAIVNHALHPVVIAELKKQLDPQMIILFGVSSVDIKLPFSFPQFKTQLYDGCTYVLVPTLNELDTDTHESKLLKSKLWVCLRQLLEI
jgi:hypothetical protein